MINMAGLKKEYHDKEILERAAEVEKSQLPYDHDVSGIEYEDLMEYFDFEDFDSPPMVMIPNRLKQLNNNGYLDQVYPNGSSANATYRLTSHGWNIVDVDPPDRI